MRSLPWHRRFRACLAILVTTSGVVAASAADRGSARAQTYTGWTSPFAHGVQPWQPWKSLTLDSTLAVNLNAYSNNVMLNYQMDTIPGVKGFDQALGMHWSWSDKAVQTDMGYGWALDDGRDLGLDLSTTGTSGSVIFHDASGQTWTFQGDPCGVGSSTAPPGIDATMTYVNCQASAGQVKYRLQYNTSHSGYDFDPQGYLVDANNGVEQQITYTYDANHRLTKITNTEGQATTIGYDASNRINTITDPFNRSWHFTYDGSGNLSQIDAPGPTGGSHAYTNLTYDASHNLTQITDPLSNKTLVSGSTITRVTNTTNNTGPSWTPTQDGDGHVTQYTFDSNGAPLTITDPGGHKTTLTYTADEKVSQETLPLGQVTKNTYDTSNNLTQQLLPSGATANASYTNYNPTSITNERGNTTSYVYSGFNDPTQITDPTGAITKFQYDTFTGLPLSKTDPKNNATSYSYDGTTKLLTGVTYPSPLGAVAYGYNDWSVPYNYDRPSDMTDGNGKKRLISIGTMGQEVETQYADNSSDTANTDADGNVTSEVDSQNGNIGNAYNALNQLVSQTLPSGKVINYTYDAVGNLLTKTDTGGSTTYTYTPDDQLASVQDPQGATTTYTYDNNGNLTQNYLPNGVTETRTYNSDQLLASLQATNADGTKLTSFTYSYTDPATNKQTDLRFSVTDGITGNVTKYTYDKDNRLTAANTTSSTGADVADYSYQYDADGNITNISRSTSSGASAEALTYNGANELTADGTTTHTFDGNGNETQGAGSETRSYNLRDQTTSITPSGRSAVPMSYLSSSQVRRTSAGGLSFQDDATGVSTISGAMPVAGAGGSLSASYTTSGQPTIFAPGGTATFSITLTNTGTATWTAGGTYWFDLRVGFATTGGPITNSGLVSQQGFALPHDVAPGQNVTLTAAVTAPTTPGTYTLKYHMVQEGIAFFPQYLDTGVSVTSGSLVNSYTISGQPTSWTAGQSTTYQVTVTNNGTSSWPSGGTYPVHLRVGFATNSGNIYTVHLVSQIGVALPADVAPGQSATLTFSLTAPSTAGGYAIVYQMVQEGLAWFPQYQDSWVTVGSVSAPPSGNTVYITRGPSGNLISERTATGTFYYLADALGSVVALTDGSDDVINQYAYDPYGYAASVQEQVANPFRYTGALLDSSTGLYKMGARYYDSYVGRFTQPDPAACDKTNNVYWYANDNPVMASDPTGERPKIPCPVCEKFVYWFLMSGPRKALLNCVVFALHVRHGNPQLAHEWCAARVGYAKRAKDGGIIGEMTGETAGMLAEEQCVRWGLCSRNDGNPATEPPD